MESLVKELVLMYFVKGNMLAYAENGGKPDQLFTMENAHPGSNAFNSFQQNLANFNSVEKRHGTLLGTGKVNVQDLSFGKQPDLEYQNLALWVMSSMLFAFGIPVTRVPFLIGKAATGGDSGGMAEAGYQRMTSEKQDEIEDLMNFQFFEPLGWHMKLQRSYKQNELREAQTYGMNADTVTKLQSIYREQKQKLTVDKLNSLLNVCLDDLEELPEEEQFGFGTDTAMRNQNFLDNDSM
ncbi:unnamed protein product, partial [marine sediment metagenome]